MIYFTFSNVEHCTTMQMITQCFSVHLILRNKPAQNIQGTLCVLPLIPIQSTHSLTHSKGWINEAKTCLFCDKFGYRSRIMFLDKNEVIPFQKCPWNALCKIGILLATLGHPNKEQQFVPAKIDCEIDLMFRDI